MTAVDSRRYWLMALGEESRHWDSCHAAGIVFIGWPDAGDLRQYQSKDQLRKRDLGMHEALACWEFVSGVSGPPSCRPMRYGG